MISLKRKESGFTIVELLIVIVVIGILAALVITTFSGVQRKARNTERETDVKAIHGQLEAYYADKGVYPTYANLNDGDWRNANMKGLDAEALKDPKGSKQEVCTATSASCYGYVVSGGDTNGVAGYTLTATLEGGGTFEKKSLN